MMKVTWAIEENVWSNDGMDRMLTSLDNANVPYFFITQDDYYNYISHDRRISPTHTTEECIIFWGSLQVAKAIRRNEPWVPGVFYTPDSYNCSHYYPKLGGFLMNADGYTMLPIGDFKRQKDWIFNTFGNNDSIFVRPNRGDKLFTGMVVNRERFDKDLDLMMAYDVEDHELVVVTYPGTSLENGDSLSAEQRF